MGKGLIDSPTMEWVTHAPDLMDRIARMRQLAEAEPFLFALMAAIWFVGGRLRTWPIWIHDEVIWELEPA